MIWFSSDLHFCHNREFLYQPRGFHNISDMNSMIINNWNSIIDDNDDVYLLGDLMLNDDNHGLWCIKQLRGNIHLIRGNHDTDNRMELYNHCYNIVEICEGKFLNFNNYHFFLSHYPCLTANLDDDKPLKARVINLCGHTHTKDRFCDMDKGLIYHVELDAHDIFPVSIMTVISDIKKYIGENNEKVQ